MISIIVTFLNGEKHVKNLIDNLLKQTNQDYEIVLIDDNSVDKSEEIIQQYKSNKIKYYKMPKETKGVGAARNYGIKKAQGNYIMFVDVDDYIDENLIENLQKYIQQDYDVIKYKMQFVNSDGRILEKVEGPCFENKTGEQAFNELCFKDCLIDSPCLYLIKKSYMEQKKLHFPENIYHEDFGLMPICIILASKMVSTDNYAYYYVQSEQSIMRNDEKEKSIEKAYDKLTLYDNLKENVNKLNLNTQTVENLLIYYTNSIILTIETLPKENRKDYIKAIKSRKMFKNIKVRNFKQLLKRLILNINTEYYLKLR